MALQRAKDRGIKRTMNRPYLERLAVAALLFGAGDWDLLFCPAEGVGRVRRDLVGVPGGEGAASLDIDDVFCFELLVMV